MKIKKTTDYLFENDVLQYRSIVKGFTDKNYEEFDESAHQSDLIRKIDDLLTGKIVNKRVYIYFIDNFKDVSFSSTSLRAL